MEGLYFIYITNILLAGWISINCLATPKRAASSVFSNSLVQIDAIKTVGGIWFAVLSLSTLGLFFPTQLIILLAFQLLYKGSWLFAVALPALREKKPFPKAMAFSFLIWIASLPFIFPWQNLLG